ncbi:MAG: hypothetical protein FIB07_13500 [Candidatus Methanoperedens sp.]|nr:hypothetical protein [Candidatus Methanoperedens sp.]
MDKQKHKLNVYLVYLVGLLFLSPIIASADVIIKGEDIIISQGIIGTKPKIVDVIFVPNVDEQYFFDSDGKQKEFNVGTVRVTFQNIGDGLCFSGVVCPVTVEIKGSKFGYSIGSINESSGFYINPYGIGIAVFDAKLDANETQIGEIITDSPTIIATSDNKPNGVRYEDTKVLNNVRFKVPGKPAGKAPGFQIVYALGITLLAFYLRSHK